MFTRCNKRSKRTKIGEYPLNKLKIKYFGKKPNRGGIPAIDNVFNVSKKEKYVLNSVNSDNENFVLSNLFRALFLLFKPEKRIIKKTKLVKM